MTNLLIIILNDIDALPKILEVWRKIGVPGTTVLESAGGHASRSWLSQVGLGALNSLFDAKEVQTRTLIAAFEDEDLLNQAIVEAEIVVGGFDRPNSGIVLVLPVLRSMGLFKPTPEDKPKVSPPAMRSGWAKLRNSRVNEITSHLNIEPAIIKSGSDLDEAALVMLENPTVHVASIVAEDGRLVGLLELRRLINVLFLHIMPEEFLRDVDNLDQLMSYANRTKVDSVDNAMIEPVWVKEDDCLKDAFHKMHEHKLPGLPIVNDLYQVCGYINKLELLSFCIQVKNGKDFEEDN